MAILPSALSPRWLLVFVVTAALWTGLALLAAYGNTGVAPTLETLRGAAPSMLVVTAPPAVAGLVGARLGFLLAHVGLAIGYLLLLSALSGPSSGGWEDLGAVANFLLLGVVGLAIGLVADLVRYFIRKRGR